MTTFAFTIRVATWNDIPSLISLERQIPTAAHWTESQYRQLLQPSGADMERFTLVAEGSRAAGPQPIAGFIVARRVASEWELENIVVAPACRRQGLGKMLLRSLLARARATNSECVFLEVRESNMAARSFYEKSGFRQTGLRPAYYVNPSENAILYRRDMP